MENLAPVLEPINDLREQINAILDLLDHTDAPAERADLASKLVGICSQYEDVKDRVIYPYLERESRDSREIEIAKSDQEAEREALTTIRSRTQHVKPANGHADDAEGFEQELDRLVHEIRLHLEHEDRVVLPMFADIANEDSESVLAELERAVATASTHPNPPHNRLARAAVAVVEALENNKVHDESSLKERS